MTKVPKKTTARQNQTGITKETKNEKSEFRCNSGEVLAVLRAGTLAIGLLYATTDIACYLPAGCRVHLLCKILDSLKDRLVCQASSIAAIQEHVFCTLYNQVKAVPGHCRRSLWMFLMAQVAILKPHVIHSKKVREG